MGHSILHLCYDNPFINGSRAAFEKFYPSNNTFCIYSRYTIKGKMTNFEDAVWMSKDASDIVKVQEICKKKSVDVIVLHSLSPYFAEILKNINVPKKYRVFWVFYGSELYYSLGEKTDYPLIDNTNVFSISSWVAPTRYNYWLRKLLGKTVYYDLLEEMLGYIDYFCFWLYEDYLLLRKYFDTDIKFRHFQYGSVSREDAKRIIPNYEKTPNEIRIGHSASKTENQETIIKLISRIDKNNVFKKVMPLTYGSVYYRKIVMRQGKYYFGDNFQPILKHVPKEEYIESLSRTGVAIFGQNRQEGSGNIFPLLKSGSKVFLRENNNLLEHCRKQGYIIFSVEKDLKSIEDLQPLTPEQMDHNSEVGWKNQVFSEDFMPQLFDE